MHEEGEDVAGAARGEVTRVRPATGTIRSFLRLLPWTGEDGKPCYLAADDEGSFLSRLADSHESVQLTMAERLLLRAESAWADTPSGVELMGMVPHLSHALRDTLRVAESRGRRVPALEGDEWSAQADAVLEREIGPLGMGGPPAEVFPFTVWDGTCAVAYRWPAEPVRVGAARRLLRRHLDEWDMTALADTAELVLSELATNAVRHARDTEDRLIETRFERLPDGSLRIEVHDADESKPERPEPSLDADSGRGFLLVDELTGGRWGVSDREGPGKMVWAVCADDGTEVPR